MANIKRKDLLECCTKKTVLKLIDDHDLREELNLRANSRIEVMAEVLAPKTSVKADVILAQMTKPELEVACWIVSI